MYDPQLFTLKDQVALVTGAGAGIGRAIAETFAAAGAAVMASDLDQDAALDVAAHIGKAGVALPAWRVMSRAKPIWRVWCAKPLHASAS